MLHVKPLTERDPIPLNRCSGIADSSLPRACSLNPSTCLLSIFPCECSHLLPTGGEASAQSTLQRGRGGRPCHLQDRGPAGGPGRVRRLTKGLSVSLPSSPLLPRHADIVPSQSCIKFPGGLKSENMVTQTSEPLRVTRSRASGNGCKESGTLRRVCLD